MRDASGSSGLGLAARLDLDVVKCVLGIPWCVLVFSLLLTPNLLNVAAYRRIATESLITVQVDEITPAMLNKLVVDSVRTLDVL